MGRRREYQTAQGSDTDAYSVASFRPKKASALEASLLLFAVDASDPTYEAQLEVSRSVLREIGADAVGSRPVLMKL